MTDKAREILREDEEEQHEEYVKMGEVRDIQTGDTDDHHVSGYLARHFDNTVEIWCPSIDETKVVLGHEYINNCPMCGDGIEFESIYF